MFLLQSPAEFPGSTDKEEHSCAEPSEAEVHAAIMKLKNGTLSFAETKVLSFSLRPWQVLKPNHLNFCSSKCKQNKYVMNVVVAQGGIITATDRKHKNKGWHVELISQSMKSLKIFIFSAWFETLTSNFGLRLKFKTLISAKDKVTKYCTIGSVKTACNKKVLSLF